MKRTTDLEWTKPEKIVWKSPSSFDLTNLDSGEDYLLRLNSKHYLDDRMRPFEISEPIRIKEIPSKFE